MSGNESMFNNARSFLQQAKKKKKENRDKTLEIMPTFIR